MPWLEEEQVNCAVAGEVAGGHRDVHAKPSQSVLAAADFVSVVQSRVEAAKFEGVALDQNRSPCAQCVGQLFN